MDVKVTRGNVFDFSADTLICPANPWLNLSGGVNGELLLRYGPNAQKELHSYLESKGRKQLHPGTVVRSSAHGASFNCILHVIAIDVFYQTTSEIVTQAIAAAWSQAAELGDTSIMPSIATGYGRLPLQEFAMAFELARSACTKLPLELTLVLRSEEDVATMCNTCPSLQLVPSPL